MTAGKFADFYGSLVGSTIEQADVVRAYAQAPLMGTRTWLRLPKEDWPNAWCGLTDPIAPLVLALFRHPDAGSCWEAWNDEQMKGIGFRTIDGWPGCYTTRTMVCMTFYVGDFKLVGCCGGKEHV